MTAEIPDATPPAPQPFLTPEQLIGCYGMDALVHQSAFETTLGNLLAAEVLLCPASEENRHDPLKRTAFLAGLLAAAGTLRPEHSYLLADGE